MHCLQENFLKKSFLRSQLVEKLVNQEECLAFMNPKNQLPDLCLPFFSHVLVDQPTCFSKFTIETIT